MINPFRHCALTAAVALVIGLVSFASERNSAAAPARPRELQPDGGAHYAHLLGQRFRTRVDLYLFARHDDAECLYLGRNDGSPSARLRKLPDAVSAANIGRRFGDAVIVDVVPAGAEFVLTSETHDVTAQSGIRDNGGYPMGFICTLIYHQLSTNAVYCEFIQTSKKMPFRTPNQTIDEAVAFRIERVNPASRPASVSP